MRFIIALGISTAVLIASKQFPVVVDQTLPGIVLGCFWAAVQDLLDILKSIKDLT